MATSVFASLEELFLSVLTGHIDPTLIPAIAADLKTVLLNQKDAFTDLAEIIDAQAAAKLVADKTAADIVSIKVFLGVPDVTIVATQADLNKLGAQLTAETAAVQQFGQTIPAEEVAAPMADATQTPIEGVTLAK